MSKDFKVIDKSGGDVDHLSSLTNLGLGLGFIDALNGDDPILRDSYKYEIEDEDGNRHTVYASDEEELGRKISNRDFDD